MRVYNYPEKTTISDNDKFLIDTADNGTKSIKGSDLIKAVGGLGDLDYNSLITSLEDGDKVIPVETKRNIWRGKDLGTAITNEQFANIQNGSFKDLFLGDYWTMNNNYYRIVDFDYWITTNKQVSSPVTTHHLVIMPDYSFGPIALNTVTSTFVDEGQYAGTDGGYMGTTFYDDELDNIKTTFINSVIESSHILHHREILTNSYTSSLGIIGIGYSFKDIDLPNEIMMYGTTINAITGQKTIDTTQLAAMRVHRNLIISPKRYMQENGSVTVPSGNAGIWLRDIHKDNSFCFIDSDGQATYAAPTATLGIRPVFGVVG